MNTQFELILKIIVVTAICLNLIRLFVKARKKKKQVQEQNDKDHDERYHDYHLGDITHYDVPKNKFIQRSGTMKWTERNNNDEKKKKGKKSNEKFKKD